MQTGSGIAGNPGRVGVRCDGGYVALAPRAQMNFSDMHALRFKKSALLQLGKCVRYKRKKALAIFFARAF